MQLMKQGFVYLGDNAMKNYLVLLFIISTSLFANDAVIKKFSGSFSLNEKPDLSYEFYLESQLEENGTATTLLKLRPQNAESSCKFTIRRLEISQPRTPARSSTLFSNRQEICHIENFESHTEIINNIVLLDMSFDINHDFSIKGRVSLRGLNNHQYTANFFIE